MYNRTEMSPMYRTAVPPMYPTGMSPMNPTDMPEAGPAEKAMWARVSSGNDSNGRERVPWARELWDRIDRAVHDEMSRVGIGRRFIPLVPAADALTVPAYRVTEIRASESALCTYSRTCSPASHDGTGELSRLWTLAARFCAPRSHPGEADHDRADRTEQPPSVGGSGEP